VSRAAASPEEAAAIAAAIEQFLRDTAPSPERARPSGSGWLRAARLEGVHLGAATLGAWGDAETWGR